MRKLMMFLAIATAMACGKKKDGLKLAAKVCDCFEHAKERDDDCLELFNKAEKKLMNDPQESNKFRNAMRECTMRQIKLPK